jgi:hypothetical protein
MKYKKEVIVLKDKWNPGAHEVPEARALEMTEVAPRHLYGRPLSFVLRCTKKIIRVNL